MLHLILELPNSHLPVGQAGNNHWLLSTTMGSSNERSWMCSQVVVHTHSNISIFLLHKQNWCILEQVTQLDESLLAHLPYLALEFLELKWCGMWNEISIGMPLGSSSTAGSVSLIEGSSRISSGISSSKSLSAKQAILTSTGRSPVATTHTRNALHSLTVKTNNLESQRTLS